MALGTDTGCNSFPSVNIAHYYNIIIRACRHVGYFYFSVQVTFYTFGSGYFSVERVGTYFRLLCFDWPHLISKYLNYLKSPRPPAFYKMYCTPSCIDKCQYWFYYKCQRPSRRKALSETDSLSLFSVIRYSEPVFIFFVYIFNSGFVLFLQFAMAHNF